MFLKRLPGVSIPSGAPTVICVPDRYLQVAVEVAFVCAGWCYTQVLINGQPSPPGFSIDTIAPDNVERIEVIRSATDRYQHASDCRCDQYYHQDRDCHGTE